MTIDTFNFKKHTFWDKKIFTFIESSRDGELIYIGDEDAELIVINRKLSTINFEVSLFRIPLSCCMKDKFLFIGSE